MFTIEVIAGHINLEQRQNTKTGQFNYTQDVYFHSGGPFPERYVINTIPGGYPPGMYTLSAKSIRMNGYKKPEFNPFEPLILEPYKAATLAKAV